MKFFNPTSEYKELQLLQYIEKKPEATQKEVATIINGAASMVNVYINELEEKGYLIRDYQSPKVVFYRITGEGVKRKNYLAFSYLRELIDLYGLAKNSVEDSVKSIVDKGYKNVLLYGAGEVAETIIAVVRDKMDSGLNILGIIDDEQEKIGTEMLGYRIIARESIGEIGHDAVIITSYSFEDEISGKLVEVGYPGDRVVRFFSRK